MKSLSQMRQDIFVLKIFKEKGFFLDFGCGDGYLKPCGNNTYLLEENGWDGLSVDIDKTLIESFNRRRSTKSLVCDLTTVDIKQLLQTHNVPRVIDYFSFDVDRATEIVLANFPFDNYRFKLMTFEHDLYKVGSHVKNKAKDKLLGLGYEILIENVIFDNHGEVEDWYIDSNLLRELGLEKKKNINFKEIH